MPLFGNMDVEIPENRFDSLPNMDIYPETAKLPLANVLLEWNQNNNVRCNNIDNGWFISPQKMTIA